MYGNICTLTDVVVRRTNSLRQCLPSKSWREKSKASATSAAAAWAYIFATTKKHHRPSWLVWKRWRVKQSEKKRDRKSERKKSRTKDKFYCDSCDSCSTFLVSSLPRPSILCFPHFPSPSLGLKNEIGILPVSLPRPILSKSNTNKRKTLTKTSRLIKWSIYTICERIVMWIYSKAIFFFKKGRQK